MIKNPIFILSLGLPCFSQAAIVISEIDLANNRVELVNTGAAGTSTDISNWWWCNRVNGSPFYDQVDDRATVVGTLTTVGTTFANFEGGSTLVLQFNSGNFLPDNIGELGLYTTNNFPSSAAIVDYVAWGGNGRRDNVAAAVGLWTDTESIDVTGIAAGQTLQATPSTDGVGPAQWLLGSNTLGFQNVPEPSALLLTFASCGLLLRRRR